MTPQLWIAALTACALLPVAQVAATDYLTYRRATRTKPVKLSGAVRVQDTTDTWWTVVSVERRNVVVLADGGFTHAIPRDQIVGATR